MVIFEASPILRQVTLTTAQAAVDAASKGTLRETEHEFIIRDANINTPGRWSQHSRKVIRPALDFTDVARVVQQSSTTLSAELEICAEKLAAAGKRDIQTLRGDLLYFLQAVVQRAADDPSLSWVEEMVTRLIHETTGGELDWNGQIWLTGITVASSGIDIRKGLRLRPPQNSDFHSEDPAEFVSMAGSMFFIPASVLEVSSSCSARPEFTKEINSLSLFRLGAVRAGQQAWASNSLFPYNSVRQGSFVGSSFGYSVGERDGAALAAFVGAVADKLPISPLGHHGNPRWRGLKSYFRAVHTASDVEERIAHGVAALETLLLGGETEELSYKLSLRTAGFLRYAGFDAAKVFSDMRTSYRFRSRYAHGGEIKTNELDQANELCPRLLDYARLAVVKFLQFPDENERRAILDQLDEALLNDSVHQVLTDKLSKGLWNLACETSADTATSS
jgi:hypothetical protein